VVDTFLLLRWKTSRWLASFEADYCGATSRWGWNVIDFPVVPEKMALVNIDMQNRFVEDTPDGHVTLDRINRLAEVCRESGILVIHARHVLRPDGSNMGVLAEVAPPVKAGLLNKGAETAALHKDLVIDPRDVLLEKPRFGAFYGTDLELILRARHLDTIIISGISTETCCDTTAREAMARDFRVFFLSDGTATIRADLHEATLTILGSRFAQVLTVDEMIQKMAGAGRTSEV
jgi:nicotinamidase-related amidase